VLISYFPKIYEHYRLETTDNHLLKDFPLPYYSCWEGVFEILIKLISESKSKLNFQDLEATYYIKFIVRPKRCPNLCLIAPKSHI
jgi:hypothetical protein